MQHDYEHEMAIVAVTGEIGAETIIGLGRYILDQKTNMAEVDFAVRAEWQRKGIGTFLLHYLCEIAKSKGISGFTAYVLASNRKMLSVFHKVGYVIHSVLEDGIYEISFRFDERPKCASRKVRPRPRSPPDHDHEDGIRHVRCRAPLPKDRGAAGRDPSERYRLRHRRSGGRHHAGLWLTWPEPATA